LFLLNPQSGTPIYRQIVDQVRRLIESGRLGSGETLPSVRKLALEHAINPMTISKAYAILESEGWLVHNAGKPMTVADAALRPPSSAPREDLREQARELALAARQLGFELGDLRKLVNETWEDPDE
jgi:GntR family transcriptional regulator